MGIMLQKLAKINLNIRPVDYATKALDIYVVMFVRILGVPDHFFLNIGKGASNLLVWIKDVVRVKYLLGFFK